jgi:isoleucyl-tRNA synthetase
MAPLLTFTAEEAWRPARRRADSVHLDRFPEASAEWLDDTLERDWNRLLEVRREVARALETARVARGVDAARTQGLAIGSGLEAIVRILASPEDLPDLLRRKQDLLPTLFIVSQVTFEPKPGGSLVHHPSQDIPGLVIAVDRAPGRKCERCWRYSGRVGEHREHPTLCERCLPVVLARS